MVHAFKLLCEWGYGITQNDVMDFVSSYLLRTNQSDLFKNGRPGKDWFYFGQKKLLQEKLTT